MPRFLYRPNDGFLSTPSARRATLHSCGPPGRVKISIHALREEGDAATFGCKPARMVFLSTPSARRATYNKSIKKGGDKVFLSTPSARRATFSPSAPRFARAYFYPRPPRGGRPDSFSINTVNIPISIHALREEGDALCH